MPWVGIHAGQIFATVVCVVPGPTVTGEGIPGAVGPHLLLGYFPLPVSETACGLFGASSTRTRLAVRAPRAVGAN